MYGYASVEGRGGSDKVAVREIVVQAVELSRRNSLFPEIQVSL